MTHFLHAIVAMVAPFFMPITVEATGYTCQPIAGNPMNAPGMCIALANGSYEVMSPGMACPRDWMGMGFYVPGEGMLYCDDTGAHTFLFTNKGVLRPHTDMRFSTLSAAWRWGKQTIVIYRIRPPRKDAPDATSPGVFRPDSPLCWRAVGACRSDDLHQRGDSLYAPAAGWSRP